ncbi:MAG: hypothetical protein WCC60_17070, partial [Ilumatobacteraceae bacterium]
MDLSKISKGGQIFAGAGIVYLIASFLPWYSVEYKGFAGVGGLSDSANAWGDIGFLWGSLWALVLLAGAVLLILPAFGVAVPKLPAVAYLAVAALATLFGVLKLLIGEDDSPSLGITISASFGLFLAIIAAAAATFGAFLMFKESGGDLNDLKDMNKLKGQFTGGPGGPGMTPPPPP